MPRLRALPFDNRDCGERKLPPTAWTRRATVEAGKWAGVEPEPVEVPAAYALMNRVWFKVKRGLRGLVVQTTAGEPVVYLLCEPATRDYQVMTRADWMVASLTKRKMSCTWASNPMPSESSRTSGISKTGCST